MLLLEISPVKDPISTPSRSSKKQAAPLNCNDTVRVFFALWPAPAMQQKLHTIAEKYRATCNARVMRKETLHMTLLFIGNIKREQLPKLIKAGDKIVGAAITPFDFELNKLAFWKHNRIGYAQLKADVPELEKLVAALKQNLTEENIAFDNIRFSPHVTLLRNVEDLLPTQDFKTFKWRVSSFVLIESVAIHKTEYRLLKEWPLAAPIKST